MEGEKKQVRDADDVIREYYEQHPEAAFRADATEPVSTIRDQGATQEQLGELSGGDPDAVDHGGVGAETPTGSNPTPDQDIVDEIGKAVGIEYQDNEPLKFGDKMAGRDADRWELDPASSEDYDQRSSAPAEPASEAPPTGAAPKPKPRKTRSRASSPSGHSRRRKPRAQ